MTIEHVKTTTIGDFLEDLKSKISDLKNQKKLNVIPNFKESFYFYED